MLARKYRLSRKEIVELKERKPQIIQGSYFGLIYQPQPGEKKFAAIVSTKISRKATERNRIKRMLFSVVGEVLFDREGKFLFLAKKKSLEGTREDFLKEAEDFRKKLG